MTARRLFIIVRAVPAVVALACVAGCGQSGNAGNAIKVSGNIEVTDIEVSFKIPGRVVERAVDEGMAVEKGELIARLDDSELVRQVEYARAQLAAAEAALAELEAGSRPEEIAAAQAAAARAKAAYDEMRAGSRPQEIAAAEAAVASARAASDKAKLEFEQQSGLYVQGVVSKTVYDAARTSLEAAEAIVKQGEENLKLVKEGPRKEELMQARAAAEESDARLALVKAGPRKEAIDNTRARARQAQESLALAQTYFGYATIVSPLSGMVLSKNVEPGEYVAAGAPVVTVADLSKVFLRAYVNESDLGRVKLGQRVSVTTDSYPGKTCEGRITFIASQAEFTPKNVQTQEERVKLVYRIKVEIANPLMELKAGMPADGLITVQ